MPKRCSRCKTEKPLDQFGRNKSRKDGKQTLCFPCMALQVAEYRARNKEKVKAYAENYRAERQALINRLKLEAGCMDCGFNAHSAALHFDHPPGVEKYTRDVSRSGTLRAVHNLWPVERILAEAAKCEVVCANCHAIRGAKRRGEGKSSH
ncbi:hypothetical protein Vwe01_18080 [Micromonospora andamanensis]|nr:hypothetical protein Vwe01_18080 [Micromonospora andamanensis]